MPWTTDDVEGFTKKATTDAAKRNWVAVANSVLARCLADGGDEKECASRAVVQANGVIAKRVEETMELGYFTERDWDTAYQNSLPDSSFAVICSGGEKDEEGKTVPRSLRKLPYKDADGKVDLAHLRNALARVAQPGTDLTPAERAKATRILKAAAKEHLKSYEESLMRECTMISIALLLVPEDEAEAEVEETPPEAPPATEPAAEVAPQELESPQASVEAPLEHFVESASGHAIELCEADTVPQDAPLELDVVVIEPGWGNSQDSHYYPQEVLKASAPVWAGTKMYATDHRQEEKNVQTWVSTVREIVGFTPTGAPIARVAVHKPWFAEDLRRLKAAGMLDKMECSILAQGRAKKGEVDGKPANIVEAITKADSVDWVTRAGAGGRVINFAETDVGVEETQPEPPTQTEAPPASPVPLSGEVVTQRLAEAKITPELRAILAAAPYAEMAALDKAILNAVQMVERLTGAGKPFAQGATTPAQSETFEQLEERRTVRFNQIMRTVGAREV